jgi:hypothetical protein
MSRIVRLYPAAWRERYGEELAGLIADMSDGRRPSLRLLADVARGAGRERLRAARPAPGGARGGVLLVLCAWALFVVAGAVVQKTSEHWQDALPAAGHGRAAAGFGILLGVAVVAAVLVAAGIALALPATVRFLRGGGWAAIQERVLTAVALSVVAVAATVALVVWASRVDAGGRDGRDAAYAAAFVGWGVLCVAALAGWTAAATALARRIELTAALLRAETALAVVVAGAMAAMTVATAVWWAAVAARAPGFLGGGSGLPVQLVGAMALMVAATALGGAGAWQAVRR